jgi:hypothetical protein
MRHLGVCSHPSHLLQHYLHAFPDFFTVGADLLGRQDETILASVAKFHRE